MTKKYFLFYFLIISLVSFGQISQGGLPYSFTHELEIEIEESLVNFPSERVVQSLYNDDKSFYCVGTTLPTSLNPSNSGTWVNHQDGSRSWLLQISSSNAIGLSLNYSSLTIPSGAEIFLYNEKKNHIIGKFTSSRNKTNPITHTQIIEGETTIIEYHEPANCNQSLELQIVSVGYYFRGFEDYFASFDKINNSRAENCQIDVACSPENNGWSEQIDAVVHFTFVEGGNIYVCSGSVINNTNEDCTPYILTAWHCGEHTANQNLSGYTWYWNYQKSSCQPNNNGSNPSKGNETMINGAVRSTSGSGSLNNPPDDPEYQLAGSDFTLVELNAAIPESYNAYYAGWDNSNSAATSGVSIHHPDGSAKKISTFNSSLYSASYNGGADNAHWVVNWVATANGHGVTEGGSSGSPIFNQDKRIVGQLSGGSSYCNSPNDADLYGKFSTNWVDNGSSSSSQLEPWLDPAGLNVSTLDGTYFPCNSFTCSASSNISSITVGSSVNFSGSSNQNNNSWTWSFDANGIGGVSPSSSSSQNPSNITFNNQGVYNITLTVSSGGQTCTSSLQITVSGSSNDPCDAAGNSDCSNANQNEYISNVSIEDINNNSGCSDYTDYTNLSASLTEGNSYTINVETAIAGSSSPLYVGDEIAVWIDYNNNLSFEDDGERVGYIVIGSNSNWDNTFEFTIPENIIASQVHMRIRISYNDGSNPIESCGDSEWGEVEDYSLNLIPVSDDCNTNPVLVSMSSEAVTSCEFGNGIASVSVSGGTPPYSYLWGNGGTSSSIINLDQGSYAVTVTDSDGCTASGSVFISVNITNPQTGNISGASEVELESTEQYSVSATSGSDYNWSVVNGTIISGQGSNSVSVLWNGVGDAELNVTETDNLGCQGDQVNLSISVISSTGLNHTNRDFNISIYPNPTENIINIEVGNYNGKINTRIYDMIGNLILQTEKNSINISSFSKGIYLVKVGFNDYVRERKLIIE